MKFSTPVRYAIRILLTLHSEAEPVSIAAVAEQTGIAPRTVEKLHAALRESGITSGIVGAKGGIRLALPLERISLGKLLKVLDGGVDFVVCCGDKANECPNRQRGCPRYAAWKELSAHGRDFFDEFSLDKIVRT
jgi:Rrf2 family protein